jgi:hypothetical protein
VEALNYVRKNVLDVAELCRRSLPVRAGRRNNPTVRTRARLTEWSTATAAPSALRRIDPGLRVRDSTREMSLEDDARSVPRAKMDIRANPDRLAKTTS